ncbi:D-lyxose/D-mannose family sugar isomerase [Pacificibacter maritimus]|uniref:D-lyxose/D-mannose family sugar isomerase n=1 Tax=Pacificibacter maritimus TaxID=762213 RepID=UPI000F506104|nr:D-lyxose/D-mannose family sugar isomerase [Pacificibacter maritimus]
MHFISLVVFCLYGTRGVQLTCLRQSSAANVAQGMSRVYAEKLLILNENQVSPMHRHDKKTKDFITCGGGAFMIEVSSASAEGGLDDQAPS